MMSAEVSSSVCPFSTSELKSAHTAVKYLLRLHGDEGPVQFYRTCNVLFLCLLTSSVIVCLVVLGLLFFSFSKQTSFVPFVPQVISPPGTRQNCRLVLSLLRCDPTDSRLQQLQVFRFCYTPIIHTYTPNCLHSMLKKF